MKWARLLDNYAQECIDFDPTGRFSPELIWTEVADDCATGAHLVDDAWVDAPIPAPPPQENPDAETLNLIETLKLQIGQIEGEHPITPRLLRELTLIVRSIVHAVAPTQPPVYGLEVAKSLDDSIVALRAAIHDAESSL